MASKRTISYIGLWALIIPWLGFSWQTKTVLFSLTGAILLVIGNRHYNNEKKKQKIHSHTPVATPEYIPEVQTSVPINQAPASFVANEREVSPMAFSTPAVDTFNVSPAARPRVRRKVEMTPRVRRVPIKSTHVESDHFDSRVPLEDLS